MAFTSFHWAGLPTQECQTPQGHRQGSGGQAQPSLLTSVPASEALRCVGLQLMPMCPEDKDHPVVSMEESCPQAA